MMIPRISAGLIYADPPWAYRMYSDKGYEKSPQAHYDCMTADQLAALRDDVIFAAAPDCVLFMWAVWPMLREALLLMQAWGFSYKTGGAWHKRSKTWTPGCDDPKTSMGTGYIFRSACEPFLIGTTGAPRTLNKSTRNIIEGDIIEDNVIEAAVREHSRKPDCVYGLLEGLFPGPYLELFARTQREGWTACGNETGKFQPAGGEA